MESKLEETLVGVDQNELVGFRGQLLLTLRFGRTALGDVDHAVLLSVAASDSLGRVVV